MFFFLIICIVAASTPSSIFHQRFRGGAAYRRAMDWERATEEGIYRDYTTHYFSQKIHHQPNDRTFRQRYWVDKSAWNGTGPAILYIGGEGPENGSPQGSLAQFGHSIHAILFTLEHRWYGESFPGSLTDKSFFMSTLSVDLAQRDLKAFTDWAAQKILLNESIPWIIVGGSYAGAMAAWTKERYPATYKAAWSSSGVVNSIFSFVNFDGHVSSALPTKCRNAVKNALATVEEHYDNTSLQSTLRKRFSIPEYYGRTDVMWMLADAVSMAVQYGNKNFLCDYLVPVSQDPLGQLHAFVWGEYGSKFTSTCSYSTECLSDPKMAHLWDASGYQWIYQTCRELGYWQEGYPGSLRSRSITTEYFIDQCRQAFSTDIFSDTFTFNAIHGGARPDASYVVATQGSDDPWQKAGVQTPLSPKYPVLWANCTGCGHCGDLSISSHHAVQQQQRKTFSYLKQWLQEAK